MLWKKIVSGHEYNEIEEVSILVENGLWVLGKLLSNWHGRKLYLSINSYCLGINEIN